jgi:hypothetical protein
MGNMQDYFPSTWLKSEDLDGPTIVTIKQVYEERFPGKRGEQDQLKPVLRFKELEKAMVLNRTNFQTLVEISGKSDSDHWIGVGVQLRVERVQAFGDLVDAIRIHPAPRSRRYEGGNDAPDWVTDPA